MAVALLVSVLGIAAMVAVLSYQSYYAGAGLFAAFTLLLAFSSLFIGSGAIVYSAFLVPFLFSIYYLPKSFAVFTVLIAACFIGIISCWLIRREVEVNLSSSPHRPLRSGMPLFFTSAALIASLLYYGGIKDDQYPVLIPKKAFDLALPYISRSLVQFSIEPNKQIDDYIKDSVKVQLSSGEIAQSAVLPPAEMQRFIDAERRELSGRFGIELKGNELLGDVLFDLTNKKALEFASPYMRFMGIFLAAGLFFGLKTASIVMYWITLGLMPLLVYIAKKTALLKEETHTVEVSRLSL